MTRCADMPTACRFQSTPPARGATGYRSSVLHRPFYFNPRPPRGGRQNHSCVISFPLSISIHAPREGGDTTSDELGDCCTKFQSTPPARGATKPMADCTAMYCHFNPRPPRGGRHGAICRRQTTVLFQSTPPARGATYRSIVTPPYTLYFNPRPPRGGRPPWSARIALTS